MPTSEPALPPIEEGAVFTSELVTVYEAEVQEVRRRRQRYGLDTSELPPEGEVASPDVGHGMIGLALSGGGIRSATFALGVVQALVRQDLLRFVDYLSAVSGGGYVASCLTSLLTADRTAGVRPANDDDKDECPLGFPGGDRERPEVLHLRDYSNYIAPLHGPFRLETWRIIAWYTSALFFNLLSPLALAASAVMVGYFFVVGLMDLNGILQWLVANEVITYEQWTALPSWVWWQTPLGWLAIAIATTGTVGAAILFFLGSTKTVRDRLNGFGARSMALLVIPAYLAVAPTLNEYVIRAMVRVQPISQEALVTSLRRLGACHMPADCGYVQGPLERLTRALELSGMWLPRSGVFDRILYDELRASGVQLSDVTRGTHREYMTLEFWSSIDSVLLGLRGVGIDTTGSVTWLGSMGSVLLSLLIAGIPPALLGYAKRSRYVFVMAAVAMLTLVLGSGSLVLAYEDNEAHWGTTAVAIGLAGVVFGFLPINRVSMLNFYRDRLADCYVIRRADAGARPLVETNDALALSKILPHANGPYLLLNATLNLSGSTDLSLRGRMAAPFLFSKHYCGSSRHGASEWCVGYRATSAYAGGKLELATAMAISGAAVSPQAGASTSPGLALVLSLLNLRLGQWLPNPVYERTPRLVWWNAYFAKELFSRADENDWYVDVSDGGHFENTGIYSLLERRCRVIIAVDNGCDPQRCFQDMGGLVRKARIDFGIDIQLDVHTEEAQRRLDEDGYLHAWIRYPEGLGALVYIKPTASRMEHQALDVLEYATTHADFPQETTADQFFDEAQFESYRELGYRVAKRALAGIDFEGWLAREDPRRRPSRAA